MNGTYLEVTFRKGKPIAAYLYLPRETTAKVARCEKLASGLVVDFDEHDRPLGVEITAPGNITSEDLNRVLEKLGVEPLQESELAPLHAA
jgi:hypothetical protein